MFVQQERGTHMHVERTAARLPLSTPAQRVHRRALLRSPHPDALCVEPLDAVYDAVLCQSPREAVATIDSALSLGVLHPDDIDECSDGCPPE